MGIRLTHFGSAVQAAGAALRRGAGALAASLGLSGHGNGLRDRLEQAHLPGTAHAEANVPAEVCTPIDPDALNARVRIGREPDGESWRSVLIVEICGTIHSPDEDHEVSLEVALSDVTDPSVPPMPVVNRPKHGPLQLSSYFVHQNPMGKLCRQTTVLEDWTTVAQLSPQRFVLARQGSRRLQVNVAILSQATGERLAATTCIASYESIEAGYLDIEDNIQRAKTLAVGLAFSVAAADNQLPDSEVLVIQGWVRTNFGTANASASARLELDHALEKTAGFFRKGGKLNVQDICREIVETAPMVGRIEIMDLCLRVAGAKGQVTRAEMILLKDLAAGLAVERTRLRTMVEKILPVHMHADQDSEMILGVTESMSKEETRTQLNREYAKWSSRVISSDPSIRKQADEMLNLIANARTQYVGVRPLQPKA